MTNYFIIPGYQGSGPGHWQTKFEDTDPSFQRIVQKNWNEPDIQDWVENIEKVLQNYDPKTVVLVAHSLGCLAVAEWAAKYQHEIKAAMLVAPPDTELIIPKIKNQHFEKTVNNRLPFPTKLVASTNDHWATFEKIENYASNWGSELVSIGDAGHINDVSGHGNWPLGLEILKQLGD